MDKKKDELRLERGHRTLTLSKNPDMVLDVLKLLNHEESLSREF